jgi:hypothetical protein
LFLEFFFFSCFVNKEIKFAEASTRLMRGKTAEKRNKIANGKFLFAN